MADGDHTDAPGYLIDTEWRLEGQLGFRGMEAMTTSCA